jgi:hypothetical protein
MSGTVGRFDGNRLNMMATVPDRQSWLQGASRTAEKSAGNRFDGCRQPCAVADGSEGNARRLGRSFAVLWVATVATVVLEKKEEDEILFYTSCRKWMVATVAG